MVSRTHGKHELNRLRKESLCFYRILFAPDLAESTLLRKTDVLAVKVNLYETNSTNTQAICVYLHHIYGHD